VSLITNAIGVSTSNSAPPSGDETSGAARPGVGSTDDVPVSYSENEQMRVIIPAVLSAAAHGVVARSLPLSIAGYGRDEQSAIASLTQAGAAWCGGLAARGKLEEGLSALGLTWDREGDTTVVSASVLNHPPTPPRLSEQG